MKYLLLNGSPKKKKSVTMIVANEFIEGIKKYDSEADIDIIHLADCNINHCKSCFACWSYLFEGECAYTKRGVDDMTWIMEKYYAADKFILVTPLHFCGISSYLQKFLERTFPLVKAVYFSKHGDTNTKYTDEGACKDMSTRDIAVISTCKLYYDGVWDAIDAQLRSMSGGKSQHIFSTQPFPLNAGGKKVMNEFFEKVREAGYDFAQTGIFSEKTQEELTRLIVTMRNVPCNVKILK